MNRKLCCFYLNDIHLITMLLPYINERINQSTKIITIFEKDISESAKRVIFGIQGKKPKKLLRINWKGENLEELEKSEIENSLVIISGSDEFMNKVNETIRNSGVCCEILNCFEMVQGGNRLYEILDEHDKVVNTSGERFPNEIFTGYTHKVKM